MKTVFFAYFVIISSLLISCGDKQDDPTPNPPRVSVTALLGSTGEALIADQEVVPGDSVIFIINAGFPGGFKSLSIYDDFGGINEFTGENLPIEQVDTLVDFRFIAVTKEDDENTYLTHYFTLRDQEGQTDSVTYEFLVGASPRTPAQIYTLFELFAPQSTRASKSFFSTALGDVYSWQDVIDDQAKAERLRDFIAQKIDFGVYFDNSTRLTITSPDLYASGPFAEQVEGWDSLTNTLFYDIQINSETFDRTTSFEQIEQVMNGAVLIEEGEIRNIEPDTYFGFSRVDQNKGLLRIREVLDDDMDGVYDGPLDGVIIDVIIQQSPYLE